MLWLYEKPLAPLLAAEIQSPEQTSRPNRVETAEPWPTRPAPRLFKTATERVEFATKLKGTFLPPKKRHFDDDVYLEAYKPDALSFADKQRKGAHEAFDGRSSMKGHIGRDVNSLSR